MIARFEFNKLVQKKTSLIFLIVTSSLFPALISILSHLDAAKNNATEGMFINSLSYGIISFSQLFFFIPAWIILFIGSELRFGHVNRVSFLTSKQFFFRSKLYYCVIVICFFLLLGSIAFELSVLTSPFRYMTVPFVVFTQFFAQYTLITFVTVSMLLAITFLIRSPLIAYLTYVALRMIEGAIDILIEFKFKISIDWLPFSFIESLYINGKDSSANYYNPIFEKPELIFIALLYSAGYIVVAYFNFMKRSLKPMSD